ncbi:RNA methyltransferase [Haloechinothrix sp. LS1_15]|nr:RNA methyltransferase [Haloechinothrix sp. LS1_15]
MTRAGRREVGAFLAEGVQPVREALRAAERVREIFATATAAERHPELLRSAAEQGVTVSRITDRAGELLSETVTPQGVVAVCDTVEVPLYRALPGSARLVAVLAGTSDPGNAGTVIRTADAAGADAVVLTGDTVDVHNGKCVRASTGSVFHITVARAAGVSEAAEACRRVGLRVIAADGAASTDLRTLQRDGTLAEPVAWVFGNEAHGLDSAALAAADTAARVPIYGGAESLNLASAAAVCLYASAMAAPPSR